MFSFLFVSSFFVKQVGNATNFSSQFELYYFCGGYLGYITPSYLEQESVAGIGKISKKENRIWPPFSLEETQNIPNISGRCSLPHATCDISFPSLHYKANNNYMGIALKINEEKTFSHYKGIRTVFFYADGRFSSPY